MTLLGGPDVDDYTPETVLVVLGGEFSLEDGSLVLTQVIHRHVLVLHHLHKVFLREALLAVLLHVDLHGELAVVVDLELRHGIEIELETLKDHKERIWHAFDAAPLQGIDLLLTLFTEVGIVTLKHLPLDKGLETLLDGVLVLNLEIDSHKGLLALRVVRATLADELVSKDALVEVLDDLLLLLPSDKVLHTVDGHVKELVNVLLDHRVNGRAVDVLEGSAEFLGIEVLSLDLHEAAEYHLDLMKDVFFVRLFPEVGIFHL
jgi:hypothetical protein